MSTGYVTGGQRVTRKLHLCEYCLAEVPAGALARWWVWADAGTATTCYAHGVCVMRSKDTASTWSDELIDPADFRAICEETWPDEAHPWTTEMHPSGHLLP